MANSLLISDEKQVYYAHRCRGVEEKSGGFEDLATWAPRGCCRHLVYAHARGGGNWLSIFRRCRMWMLHIPRPL